jgi:catechol 2,3-dioxygenase-like lactoylglutathione lyase family enzyme
MLTQIHHVQIAMPAGREAEAIDFYAGVLGMKVVEKPAELAGRGGVWFEAGEIRLHLGVEESFRPARKAHPAFRVAVLADTVAQLRSAGIDTVPDVDLPGISRVFVSDPFGNRIELLELR